MLQPKVLFLFFFCLATFRVVAQDTLVFENKYPYLVEIVEESETKVIYRSYPVTTDLAYIMKKRFIIEIRYQDKEQAVLKFKPDTLTTDNKLELWVTREKSGVLINGLLHRMDDTTLILKKKSILFDGLRKSTPEVAYIFPYSNIAHISARKKDRIVKFAFAGATGGFIVGTLTGLAIFDKSKPCDPIVPNQELVCDETLKSPHSQWEKALTLGFASSGVGALGGGIIGGVRVKIPIGGRKSLFNAAVPYLNGLERELRK